MLTLTLAMVVPVVVVRSVGVSAASEEPIWAVAALTAVVALSVAGNVAFHSEFGLHS